METLKKIQKFLKKHQNVSMSVFVIFVISGYFFFIFSKNIFHEKSDLKYTEINSKETLEQEQREITLNKWVYCPDTQEMEVEFDVVNATYDGIDTYKVTACNRQKRQYVTSVVLSSPTMQVIRIKNVEEQEFSELRLALQVDYAGTVSKEMAKFYTNAEKVERVDKIVDYNTTEEYYIAKLNTYIANYQNEINEIQRNISEQEKKQQAADELIQELNLKLSYAAGDEKSSINSQIADVNKQLIELNTKIQQYKTQITEIQKNIADYEAIKNAYAATGND